MRGYKPLALLTTALLLVCGMATAQESNLKYLPEDAGFVVGLDFQKLKSILPAEMMEKMQPKMGDVSVELLDKIDYFLVALPENLMMGITDMEDFYALMMGSLTIDDMLAVAKEKGEPVKSKQIGNLTAYFKPEEDMEMYISEVGPGMMVVGSESGLTKYIEVAAGRQANALSNPLLKEVLGAIDTSGLIFLAGQLPEQAKSMMAAQNPSFGKIEAMGLDADYLNDFLNLRIALNSKDPSALEEIRTFMDQQIGMFTQMDPTGAVAELVDNLKYEMSGNNMVITTMISGETLMKAFKQFGAMFGGMDN